jgi:hypothetical protein
MRLSNLADAAKDTVHVAGSGTIDIPNITSGTLTFHGDMSIRTGRLRLTVVSKMNLSLVGNSKTITTTMQEVGTKRYVAARTLNKKGKWLRWSCSKVTAGSSSAGVSVTPNPQSSSQQQFSSLVNEGTDTVDGVTVWHVHGVLAPTATSTPGSQSQSVQTTGTMDDYISQADYTLVRTTVVASVTGSQNTQTSLAVTLDFSKYGEQFHIKLPKACKHPTPSPALPIPGTPLDLVVPR